MMESKTVLSLFNGMNGGRLALEGSNIPVKKYYASEVDKYAIQASNAMYSDTVNIGDVRNVDVSKLDRIDILIGGSPCQSFSFAGKRRGMVATEDFHAPTIEEYEKCNHTVGEKIFYDYEDYVQFLRDVFEASQKEAVKIYTLDKYLELKESGFEFEGQSYLFWEYIRILTDIRKYNPDVLFFLENVVMTKDWEIILTRAIGIEPVKINSALVSAQNRKRLYWSNIKTKTTGLWGDIVQDIPQPKDRGILLKDILEDKVSDKYYLSDKMMNCFNNRAANFNNGKVNIREKEWNASTITASCASVDISDNFVKIDKSGDIKANQNKAGCLTAGGHSGGNHSDMDLIVECVAMRGRNPENPKSRVSGLDTVQMIEPREDGKTNCLTTVQKDNMVQYTGCDYRTDEGFRDREGGKSGTLAARARVDESCGQLVKETNIQTKIRRLTPRECARLQTVPEDKIDVMLSCGVSDSQIYKMLGNGWNIETIMLFFNEIK